MSAEEKTFDENGGTDAEDEAILTLDEPALELDDAPALEPDAVQTRRRRLRVTRVREGDVLSTSNHLWLIDHTAGCATKLHTFRTVDELEEFAVKTARDRLSESNLAAFHKSPTQKPEDVDPRHSTRSSSDSTSSTYVPPATCRWLDIQTHDMEILRRILSLLNLSESDEDDIMNERCSDALQQVPNRAVYMSVECRAAETDNLSRSVDVTVVACDDWIITFHTRPFEGLFQLLRKINSVFNGAFRKQHRPNALADDRMSVTRQRAVVQLTTGWVLAHFMTFVIDLQAPDPTKLIADVDRIDEMVLIFANVPQEQHDLLRSIALQRRKISATRAALLRHEKLLMSFLTPLMQATFVAYSHALQQVYRENVEFVLSIASRVDSARDILNQCNSNFASGISLSMAAASNRMNLKMHLLTRVATICLPLTLVAGIFGMNVVVPFSPQHSERYFNNIYAFIVICGASLIWFLVNVPSLIRMRKRVAADKRAYDMPAAIPEEV